MVIRMRPLVAVGQQFYAVLAVAIVPKAEKSGHKTAHLNHEKTLFWNMTSSYVYASIKSLRIKCR